MTLSSVLIQAGEQIPYPLFSDQTPKASTKQKKTTSFTNINRYIYTSNGDF